MNLRATITAEDKASGKIQGVGLSFGKMTLAMAAGNLAADALKKGLQAVVDVSKQSVGAAFNQVRAVENATFALRAYEKDGAKVNAILKDLIAYARSDMGVLFQREELFKAASNLRGFGASADTVVDKVKTLSKGVALGMTTFDELSQIVGRATQQGKVSAEIYDMLAQRGIILDQSFRGASKSSEELYKELNRVLPDELLKGRANTIDGLFIRLKSSLRDLGSTFLGVDKETSKFIEGGLGDRFIKAITRFREYLSAPQVKSAITKLAELIGIAATKLGEFFDKMYPIFTSIVQYLLPSFIALRNTIMESLPTWYEFYKNILEPLIGVIGLLLVGAIKASIDILNGLLVVLDPVMKAMIANKDMVFILIGAWAALKLALMLHGALAAATAVLSGIRTQIALTNAMASTPMVMPALAVGAAIASIYMVKRALDEVKQAAIDVNNAANAAANLANPGEMQRIKTLADEARKRGDTAAVNRYANALRAMSGNALGGNVKAGVPRVVGEQGKEVFVPETNGRIIPNHAMGGGGQVSINVNVGMYAGSEMEKRRVAEELFKALQDVASSRNMSVGKMMGV